MTSVKLQNKKNKKEIIQLRKKNEDRQKQNVIKTIRFWEAKKFFIQTNWVIKKYIYTSISAKVK